MSIAAALWTVPGGGIFSRTFSPAGAGNIAVGSDANGDAACRSSGLAAFMACLISLQPDVLNTSNVSVLSIAKTTERFALDVFIFAAAQRAKACQAIGDANALSHDAVLLRVILRGQKTVPLSKPR